jgi:hypothetical protein
VAVNTILLIAAAIFALLTLADWRRHGGGLTPKRKTWVLITGIFLAVSLYLKLVGVH